MTTESLFGLSVLMSFLAFGIVTKLYILPRLRCLPETMRGFPWWFHTCFASSDQVFGPRQGRGSP